MAQNNVHIQMTAAEASIVQAWMNANRGPQQMLNLMQRIGSQTRSNNASFSSMVAAQTAGLMRAGAVFIGIGSAVQTIYSFARLLKNELNVIAQRRESLRERQVPFQQSVERMELMMPADSDMSARDIERAIMTDTSGVNKDELVSTVISSISSDIGTKVSERVRNALDVSEIFRSFDSEGRAAAVEAVANLRAAYGGTAKEQIGFITSAVTASRATDLKMFADQIIGGIIDAQKFDLSQQQAAEMMLAVQTAANDPEGATTRTNVIKLLRQLQEVGQQLGIEGNPYEIMMQIRQGTDEKSAAARQHLLGAFMNQAQQEAMQAGEEFDPMLVEQYLKAVGSKKDKIRAALRNRERTFASVAGMLQPTPEDTNIEELDLRDPRRLQEAVGEEVRFGTDAEAYVDQLLQERRANPRRAVVNVEQAVTNFEEQAKLDDPAAAIRAQFLRVVDIARKDAGIIDLLEEKLAKLDAYLASTKDVVDELKAIETFTQSMLDVIGGSTEVTALQESMFYGESSPETIEQQRLAVELSRNEIQKSQAEAVKALQEEARKTRLAIIEDRKQAQKKEQEQQKSQLLEPSRPAPVTRYERQRRLDNDDSMIWFPSMDKKGTEAHLRELGDTVNAKQKFIVELERELETDTDLTDEERGGKQQYIDEQRERLAYFRERHDTIRKSVNKWKDPTTYIWPKKVMLDERDVAARRLDLIEKQLEKDRAAIDEARTGTKPLTEDERREIVTRMEQAEKDRDYFKEKKAEMEERILGMRIDDPTQIVEPTVDDTEADSKQKMLETEPAKPEEKKPTATKPAADEQTSINKEIEAIDLELKDLADEDQQADRKPQESLAERRRELMDRRERLLAEKKNQQSKRAGGKQAAVATDRNRAELDADGKEVEVDPGQIGPDGQRKPGQKISVTVQPDEKAVAEVAKAQQALAMQMTTIANTINEIFGRTLDVRIVDQVVDPESPAPRQSPAVAIGANREKTDGRAWA